MNEEQQNYTYHTFEFLSKRKNDPKWRPQYLERLAEMENVRTNREKKMVALLLIIILIELLVLGYLMFFNPNGNQESSMNSSHETQLYLAITQGETKK